MLTFPLIGNYGVPDETIRDEFGLAKYFESEQVHISALVVSEYCEEYSHWSAVQSLEEYLKKYDVPAIYGVDTRMLTKIIRDKGSLLGIRIYL